MLRAESFAGRLVLALAACPPDTPAPPRDRPGARLAAALAAAPAADWAQGPPPCRTSPRARWLPGLLTVWCVVLTCLTAAAVQDVLPTPWQSVRPERGDVLRAERWHLVDNGRLGPYGRADAVAFTPPDGGLLVTVTGSSVGTWDLMEPEHPERVTTRGRAQGVTAAGISPDGRTLVTAGAQGVRALAVDTGRTQWSCPDAPPRVKALLAGGNTTILAASAAGGSTELVELRRTHGKPPRPRTLSRIAPASGPAQFSPDGHTLATAGAPSGVRLWDVSRPGRPRAAGAPFGSGGRETAALAFSPDGGLLAVVDGRHGVTLWDVTDPARPRPLGHPFADGGERVTALAFSPDSRTVATVGPDGTANLWWRSPAA
ncbi:hypothetical protein OIB37_25470 [Streptomyces sp. NBC_00820]|uniref:WD40 repeat domain-containing protein n=1 Tax=Streptomyces sp. NBC_00820 TaxID=2975842 RepID=UPI002ED66B84|nr:hypothetical protein OIB37_25470 [Streptomyces sp. NBC_00820]